MARIPGDPYDPENHPIINLSEDEDPSENEEEPEEVEESEGEGLLEEIPFDDHEPEESITDEEDVAPPPSPARPCYLPSLSQERRPLLRGTPRMEVAPTPPPAFYSLSDPPNRGLKRKAMEKPSQFEIGEPSRASSNFERDESSQVPPRNDPTPPALSNRLPSRIRPSEDVTTQTLEQRVEKLEKNAEEDSEAIQILYHRMGASRTEANAMGIDLRTLQYEVRVYRDRLAAAENRAAVVEKELRAKLDELDRFVASRSN